MQNNEPNEEKRGFFATRRARIIAAVCALIVAVAVGPTLICEVLTSLHLSEFEDSMADRFGEHLKVISYSGDSAKIYAWSDGDGEDEPCLGGVIKLKRGLGEFDEEHGAFSLGDWEISGWEPMWSDDDQHNDRVVWQYWWHAKYFLF